MSNVAAMYFNGFGVARNLQTAFSWEKKSAEAGSDIGMLHLGIMYIHGEGTPVNKTLGVIWLQKSARLGNTDAQALLTLNHITW